MFGYAALRHPEHAESIARVLAIPAKRFDRALVTWLTEPEVDALLAAPDKATWAGRRDHAMLALAAQTGLRVSELTGLTCGDVHLGAGPHVSCHGKGRKAADHPAHDRPPSPSCAPGSPNGTATQASRSSRTAPADGSAATPSRNASPSTSPQPPRHAPR